MVSQTITIRPVSIERTSRFLDLLLPPPRDFDIRLWDGTCLKGTDTVPRFTMTLNTPGTLRRMFRPPIELALAEAFIRGELDIEGDLTAAIYVFSSPPSRMSRDGFALIRRWSVLPVGQRSAPPVNRRAAHLSGARHSRERDRAAVQYHYDVGNDFYALWLDKCMVYSCAYFPTGTEDLDTAQEQKLEMICRKLQLRRGETLLDIGCGWGGLVVYAAQKYGVNAIGVTLSRQQHELANQRIAAARLKGCAVKLLDYRDIRGGPFDKVVSVGMVEHVGRNHLPEYFAYAYRLLKPGGLFLNHGISMPPSALTPMSPREQFVNRFLLGSGSFIQRYIFPDGELQPVNEVNLIAEKTGFELRHVENFREHYVLTLRRWIERLDECYDEVIRLASEEVYRTWKLYLSASVQGFEIGRLSVNQTLLHKPMYSRQQVTLPDARRCCGLGSP
ncbi:MAG: cyclopropane-fatty-acyl-phospholipid synthase family protein [Anaerolineae bacterium]|nr:cyclopropane-fatty-acyl-phospholipid synthase family protein [Anaerolineae bacterium]